MFVLYSVGEAHECLFWFVCLYSVGETHELDVQVNGCEHVIIWLFMICYDML